MRKTLVTAVIVGLCAGALTAPAAAAGKKKKHVSDSFSATLAPLPLTASMTTGLRPGCSAGVEDVHWAAHEFTAPFSGDFRYYIEGFTGDWDIYMFKGETLMARSDAEQVGAAMAPPEEEIFFPFKKKDTVTLVVCNWASPQIDIEAHFELTG